MERHFLGGLLLVDKPRDFPSRKTCDLVKAWLKAKKVGTTGTLDPHASGLLVLCVNEAVKLTKVLQRLDKEYIATMHLHKRGVSDEKLRKAIASFIGTIEQVPPKRSAVARKPRKRKIYDISILYRKENRVLLKIKCEAGTYIRKLIHDMGTLLGGAHLQELRRTRVGDFHVSQAKTLDELEELARSGKLRELLLPIEAGIRHLSKVYVKSTAISSLIHGAPLYKPGVERIEGEPAKGEAIALLTREGKLIAIGKYVGNRLVARVERVILRDDI